MQEQLVCILRLRDRHIQSSVFHNCVSNFCIFYFCVFCTPVYSLCTPPPGNRHIQPSIYYAHTARLNVNIFSVFVCLAVANLKVSELQCSNSNVLWLLYPMSWRYMFIYNVQMVCDILYPNSMEVCWFTIFQKICRFYVF